MKQLALLLISLAFITSACTSSESSEEQVGTLTIPSQWKLVSFGKTNAETSGIAGSSITLEFAVNDQVSGSGGCNS